MATPAPGISKTTGTNISVPSASGGQNAAPQNAAPDAASANGGLPAAAPVPMTDAAPQHFLQRIKLFSGLGIDECQEVVKRMKRRDFPPNQIIVREGAPGNSMFFITAGLVEVRKKDPNTGIEF